MKKADMTSSKKIALLCFACLVMIPVTHCGAEVKDHFKFRRTLSLISGLELTGKQVSQLLPILQEAVEEKEKVEKEIAEAKQNSIDLYESLKNELRLQQPTEQTETAANRSHGLVRYLYNVKLVDVLLKYESRIDKILTADQIAYLMKFDSGDPIQGLNIVDETKTRSYDLMESARSMSSFDYKRNIYKSCTDFLESCIHDGLIDKETINMSSEVERMVSLLNRARELSYSAYKKSREELANELCPRCNQPRPAEYGTQYFHGSPTRILSKTSRILFTKTALEIIKGMTGT